MVVVVPNELEQKKKRQTLERAKANHLSKQLQMRLQYAKLKVEYGWQRQNLNEVENLYFHHSHQRNIRQGQGAGQRTHYAPTASANTTISACSLAAGSPVTLHAESQSPAPTGVLGRPSPSVNDASSPGSGPGSMSPPALLQSPPEHGSNPDGQSLSQPQSFTTVQAPVPVAPIAPAVFAADRPPSAFDLSDPNILARLAQLQGQIQLPSQPQVQAQILSRHPSTNASATSASASVSQPSPVLFPIPVPGAFSPHMQPPTTHPPPGFALLGTPTPGYAPLYPIPIPASAQHPNLLASPSQPPITTSTLGPAPTAPISTSSIPTPTPIAPSALTYDSFWSTHASTTGPTRALYRTHTGFTASAAPGGNVAMLTPGGHAAVMTAEGVYVGGATK